MATFTKCKPSIFLPVANVKIRRINLGIPCRIQVEWPGTVRGPSQYELSDQKEMESNVKQDLLLLADTARN